MKHFALIYLKDTLKAALELARHPPISFIGIEKQPNLEHLHLCGILFS